MDKLTFTVANNHHAAEIARLHILSWQQTYHEMLKADYLNNLAPQERLALWQARLSEPTDNQYVLMAEIDNNLAGFICVYADKDSEYGSLLDNLHVASHYHGKGIAKQLIAKAVTWLNTHAKHPALHLEVLAGNHNAIKVYQKLGGQNIKQGVWHAPCGSLVDEYIYLWPNKHPLANL